MLHKHKIGDQIWYVMIAGKRTRVTRSETKYFVAGGHRFRAVDGIRVGDVHRGIPKKGALQALPDQYETTDDDRRPSDTADDSGYDADGYQH